MPDVKQDGDVVDEDVQTSRNTKTAAHLLIPLMKRQGCPPKQNVTDCDLRPKFPPEFRRVFGFQSGSMRPVFP